jgi:LAS superfamily LD-carboxypeptidase LdcB
MREEAAKKLSEMAEKFYTDMGEKMVAVSTYRSYAYQAGIKSRGCPDNLCAKA